MVEGRAEIEKVWQRYRVTRDQALRDRLILNYAPLVKYVAGRLGTGLPAHVDEGDLVSYGLLGLIGAIERYDPGREIKFDRFKRRAANSCKIEMRLPGSSARWYTTSAVRSWPVREGTSPWLTNTKRVWLSS